MSSLSSEVLIARAIPFDNPFDHHLPKLGRGFLDFFMECVAIPQTGRQILSKNHQHPAKLTANCQKILAAKIAVS